MESILKHLKPKSNYYCNIKMYKQALFITKRTYKITSRAFEN